jgi:hypothetical protein
LDYPALPREKQAMEMTSMESMESHEASFPPFPYSLEFPSRLPCANPFQVIHGISELAGEENEIADLRLRRRMTTKGGRASARTKATARTNAGVPRCAQS